LIEVLANLKGNPRPFPDSYLLLKITIAEHVATGVLELNSLVSNWRDDLNQTKSIAGGNSASLTVPSVPSPESMNHLFNPLHRDAKGLVIEWCRWIKYDKRLLHIPETK
jgi:hypothetical protein